MNPNNFKMIIILEFALKRSPANKTFCAWLIKIYSKLGLTSLVTEYTKMIAKVEN